MPRQHVPRKPFARRSAGHKTIDGWCSRLADQVTDLKRPDAFWLAAGFVNTRAGAVTLANIAPDQTTARDILRNA
jgi:hypothetical protein